MLRVGPVVPVTSPYVQTPPPPAFHDDQHPATQAVPTLATHPAHTLEALLASAPVEIKAHVKAGGDRLAALGMEKHKARVCVVLDVSASMQNPNKLFLNEKGENQVQKLIDRAFALSILLDDDGSVELIPFGDRAYAPIHINNSNFKQATAEVFDQLRKANNNTLAFPLTGATNYPAAIRAVRQHYFKDSGERSTKLECKEPPVFTIFITDGRPNIPGLDEKESEKASMAECKNASFNAMFVKFLAIKVPKPDDAKKADDDDEIDEFAFLKSIDDARKTPGSGFFVDYIDFVEVGKPDRLSMKDLLNEYRGYLIEAYRKGLIAHPGIDLNLKTDEEGRSVSPVATAASVTTQSMFKCSDTELDRIKRVVSNVFASCRTRNHTNRAAAVCNAIKNCRDVATIEAILVNQDSLLNGANDTNVAEGVLAARWSRYENLVNKKAPAKLKTSTYYNAVQNAREQLRRAMGVTPSYTQAGPRV